MFFPFLLFPLMAIGHELFAQNLTNISSSLMNFPHFNAISLEALENRSLQVRSQFVYNDLYRKQVNGIHALTLDGISWRIDAFIPWTRAQFRFGTNLFYWDSQRWFQNKEDRTALYVKDHTVSNRGGLQLAMTDGTGLLGVGLEGYSAHFQTPIRVKSFPTSNNALMRTYFLDWLEPTFGRKLDISGNTELQRLTLFFSIPAFRTDFLASRSKMENRLKVFFGHLSFSSHPEILYRNSSNKQELRGNRKIDIPFTFRENSLDVGVKDEHANNEASITLFDSRFTFYLNNNPPPTDPILLDHDQLGSGEGGRSGFSIKYSGISMKYLFQIGLGKAHYFGKFNVDTPVLGYYEDIFPISHGVKGKLVGNSFSQMVKAGFASTILSARSFFRVGYSHGFFDLRIDGDAPLEFGLVSVPVHHPLQYHVHVVEIHWKLVHQFGPITGLYSFTQFIPFVVRSDRSPIRLSEKVLGVKTRSRGGSIHQFVIGYQW